MKAIIMAGGEGTRLGSLTDIIPKALLAVGEKTLTELVRDILKKFGITDIFLSVAHKKDQLKEKFMEEKKEYFNEFIENVSDNIRELLEKMCSYVSIQAILNVSLLENS